MRLVAKAMLVAALAVTMAPSAGVPAMAADPAELLIRKGVEARRKGNDREAFSFFREANALSHTPRAAAQLGLCELALKMWSEAEAHLSEALVAESDPWVGRNRSILTASLEDARKHLARLTISGSPVEALVEINGQVLGRLSRPIELRVPPGPVSVVVTAEGFESQRESPIVAAGEERTVRVSLRRILANESPPPVLHAAAVETQTPPHEPASDWKIAGYTVTGIGAVSLLTGIYFGTRAKSLAPMSMLSSNSRAR
jgi:hypothetical protein